MSATDLKSLLHEQIDRLQREEDLQDLLLTVHEFVSYRGDIPHESPELIAQLHGALLAVKAGGVTPHSEVTMEAKQWLTR